MRSAFGNSRPTRTRDLSMAGRGLCPPREETTPRGAVVETAHKAAETLARQTIHDHGIRTVRSPSGVRLVSFPDHDQPGRSGWESPKGDGHGGVHQEVADYRGRRPRGGLLVLDRHAVEA